MSNKTQINAAAIALFLSGVALFALTVLLDGAWLLLLIPAIILYVGVLIVIDVQAEAMNE